jgi:hypothetical protein
VFNFGLVGLAENFMLGVQSCNSKNDPIAVRLVISVNTQVFVALLGESSQYSFQKVLEGAFGTILYTTCSLLGYCCEKKVRGVQMTPSLTLDDKLDS